MHLVPWQNAKDTLVPFHGLYHGIKVTVRLELLLPLDGFELIEEVLSGSESFVKSTVLAVAISRLNQQ